VGSERFSKLATAFQSSLRFGGRFIAPEEVIQRKFAGTGQKQSDEDD
jgi:hypothetical protein